MTLLKKEIDYFEDFYKYNKLFESLNICYTADQIDNMTGEKRIFYQDWVKIKKESPLSYKQVSEYLLYILISQLNNWIGETKSIETDDKTYSSISINTIIAKFIIKVLDKIKHDTTEFTLKDNYDSYVESLLHQRTDKYNMRFKKMSYTQKEFLKEVHNADTQEELQEKMEDQKEQLINERIRDKELNEYAKEMLENSGKDANPQSIEDFKDDMAHEQEIDDEIEKEFDSTQPVDIDEIMDVGDGYGETPQGTETAGSGINELTFRQEVAQFEGHVGGPPPYGQITRDKAGPLELEAIPETKLKSWGWTR